MYEKFILTSHCKIIHCCQLVNFFRIVKKINKGFGINTLHYTNGHEETAAAVRLFRQCSLLGERPMFIAWTSKRFHRVLPQPGHNQSPGPQIKRCPFTKWLSEKYREKWQILACRDIKSFQNRKIDSGVNYCPPGSAEKKTSTGIYRRNGFF